MIIIGAGLSGLIAAHAFPHAEIIESADKAHAAHAALLRFRSAAVSHLTGIEFQQVTVRKGIWHDGAFREPDIRLANLYSQKILGRIESRSVWNLEAVTRYIAPPRFYEMMLENVGNRVRWGTAVEKFDSSTGPIISTIPMPDALGLAGISHEGVDFARAPIMVFRFHVPCSSVYQTVYFTDPALPVYRASLTGALMIVEATVKGEDPAFNLHDICAPFSLWPSQLQEETRTVQRFGKISPISDAARKSFMFRLTHEHGVYSIGRFATWKNILLDDVVDDLKVVRRLIQSSEYDKFRSIASAAD